MANKVGYIIQLQDRFSRAAKKISVQMKGIAKNADKAANTINKKLTKSFKGLGNTAKNVLGGIIAAFSVRELISRGVAFQDAIADLSSITGEAGESLKFLSDESLRLAKSSSITQVDVVKAFTAIASAKSELLKDPKGLSIVTEQALLLANAAGIEVPDAVRASVGALNQFGEGADQAARFVNTMAAATKIGASLVGETAEAMKNAGTVAAKLGLSFESTNAILQVFAKNEIKGAEAGTKLRGTLIALEKKGGKFAPSVVGIDAALQNLAQTQFTNTELIQDFGNENLTTALILRSNVSLIKKWTKGITGTNVAQQQADARLGTFSAKLRKLGVIINDKVIKLFDRLEPTLKKNVESMGDFFDTIKPEQIDALGDSLSVIATIFGLIGTAIKIPLSLLKGVGTVIGEIAGAIATLDFGQFASVDDAFSIGGKVFGSLDQLPPNGATDAIKKLEMKSGAPAQNFNADIVKSQTDINLNLRAPEGVIESIKSKTTGKRAGLNMGVNMEAAL